MNDDFNNLDWIKEKLGIQDFLGVKKLRSDKQNNVLKIETKKGSYILKQGINLINEKERLFWLDDKLPVPQVIAWQDHGNKQELLMTFIEGEDLAQLSKKIPKERLVDLLADTLHSIHRIDIADCPFGKKNKDSVFIHGDACLPNFIVHNNKLSGIIDLGEAGIGEREDDLAAAVWSLEYNFGEGMGVSFLTAYGIDFPTALDVERLRLKYESGRPQRFQD